DLVSYNQKQNGDNPHQNSDGVEHNLSWNCGAEGPTDDPSVLALRSRQRRNLLATLVLSQGTPMLLAGDEFGRTQRGNNNAYCQDNELSWVDWSLVSQDRGKRMASFVHRLIGLRRDYPMLRRSRFLIGVHN